MRLINSVASGVAVALVVLALGCAGSPEKDVETGVAARPWHHVDGGFRNPPGSPERNQRSSFTWFGRIPWVINRLMRTRPVPPLPEGHVMDKAEALAAYKALDGRDTVTWIGHMTALLRLGGATVLTDPFFSERPSPIPGLGPKRYVAPGIALEDLPAIDVVLISHAHFDHLDLPSIGAIAGRENITAIVPLKIGPYFRERGYGRVVELDWYESAQAAGLRFTALPVIHWSKRSIFATNDTLWAAFAISAPTGARLYFGGDAEYGPVYAQVGAREGGFDLAMLSVGAFRPRRIMNGAHCVPANCVRIGLDVGAQTMVAMHWGTIPLGEDQGQEAALRFRQGGRELGLADERLWIMRIGETRVIPRREITPAATSP